MFTSVSQHRGDIASCHYFCDNSGTIKRLNKVCHVGERLGAFRAGKEREDLAQEGGLPLDPGRMPGSQEVRMSREIET